MTLPNTRYRLLLQIATLLIFSALAVQAADSGSLSGLATGERWQSHLTGELLPFWSVPAALGNPVGAFPSVRCDDGSALDFARPCAPIAGNGYLLTQARYLVALSRQTYGYGVAFHLTGDPKYLGWMKAGIAYIRRNAVDPSGGMFTMQDLRTGAWGPAREFRNPQELGYGLLSLAFYYYLTRDDDVLADIVRIKKYLFDSYYSSSLGTMQWLLESNGDQRFDGKQLVADLDQMNTYLVLLAPILPEPHRSEWKQTLAAVSQSMLGTFYSPEDNLFFTGAGAPRDTDLAYTGVDFGHTSKALWMLRFTGLITGDDNLFQFAALKGQRHLERAFLEEDGSWAQGVLAGGAVDKNKNWWIYAELDQFSATLALADMRAGRYLPRTNDYWFRYFVDRQHGEVWNGVNYGTNAPQRDFPKAWAWKNAYHSFEHALVGYITAQQLHRQPVKLHYAFVRDVGTESIRPYYFSAPVDALNAMSDSAGNRYQEVTFRAPEPAAAAPALVTVSGASFLGGPLATGSIASVWGSDLAAVTAQAGARLTTDLGGSTVTVKDAAGHSRLARLFYVSPAQVNFQIPPETQKGDATITVRSSTGKTVSGQVRIVDVSPGVFQSNLTAGLLAGNAVRVHHDQSQTVEAVCRVDSSNTVVPVPVDLGATTDAVYLSLYGTGIRNAKRVAAAIGGRAVAVPYAGSQGAFAGLDQVNIGPLPRSLAGSGRLTIVLTADGQTANPVEVFLK